MSPQQNQSRSSLFGALFIPVLVIGALIIIAVLVMSFSDNERAVPDSDGPTTLSAATMKKFTDQYDALGQSIGSPDAPVTIREFGDYQCPACGAFEPTAERIRDEYVKTGKARFIFFDFPLQMHSHSHQAAVAARCAADQNRFWPYHGRLYKTQDQWSQMSDPTSMYLDLAVESGVDSSQLKQCMAAEKPTDTIQKEMAVGQDIKLRATPTVLVNDTMFTGAPTYEKLQTLISQANPGAAAGKPAASNTSPTPADDSSEQPAGQNVDQGGNNGHGDDSNPPQH